MQIVEKFGSAVILKNNKTRYVVVDFEECDEIQTASQLRMKNLTETADTLISENIDAFKELAE